MATDNGNENHPQQQTEKRPPAKKRQLDSDTYSQLMDLNDNLHQLLSTYQFFFATIYELCASGRNLHSSYLLTGFSQTDDWLADRSEQLLQTLEQLTAKINQ